MNPYDPPTGSYDWSVDDGPPLIMYERDINRAVMYYAHNTHRAAELYVNLHRRRPDEDPEELSRLAQAAAMTSCIAESMQWGSPAQPELANLSPLNPDWMLFVEAMLKLGNSLEFTLAEASLDDSF